MYENSLSMKLTLDLFRKYTIWTILGASAGIFIHIFLIWIDSQMVNKPIFIDLEESFWQSAFSFPFLPMLLLEIFLSVVTILLWVKMKYAVNEAHRIELERVNHDTTVKTLQQTMSLLAQHIATNNNKILGKIEFRRHQGQQTSETIEKSSKNIASILTIMSEISFVEPYVSKSNSQTYLLDELERRLKDLE
jgi:ABC-type multidrug transport system fused ATPase/permease subunit